MMGYLIIMLKILVLNTIGTDRYNEKRKGVLEKYARSDVEITVASLQDVPEQVGVYYTREMVAVPKIVEKVNDAEINGFSGVLINCFGDPGLNESRESVKIPVVGSGEASMHVAAMIGSKFSILAPERKSIPAIEKNVMLYGLTSKLASILPLNIPVPDITSGLLGENLDLIVKKINFAIENNGAEVIMIACTGSIGLAMTLQESVRIPVVDPCIVPYKLTEMFADLFSQTKFSHSKIGKYLPPVNC